MLAIPYLNAAFVCSLSSLVAGFVHFQFINGEFGVLVAVLFKFLNLNDENGSFIFDILIDETKFHYENIVCLYAAL